MHTHFLKVIFGVLLILAGHCVWAQKAISLDEEISSIAIADKVYYLETDGQYSLSEVQGLSQEKWFQIEKGETLNKGYTPKTYWVKIPLKSEHLSKLEWILHIEYHMLDSIQAFLPSPSGEYEMLASGRAKPFYENNPLEHVNYAYPLGNPMPEGGFTVYLKINSKGPLMIPLFLSQERAFSRLTNNNHIYYGIYFGCLCVMIFYNLFIFLSFRDINYLYYVLTIISTMGIFMTVAGYSYKYVMPDAIWLNMYFTRILMGFVVITTGVFARSFLQTKKYARWTHNALLVTMVLAAIAVCLSVLEIKSSAINGVVSIHSLLLITTGIVVWKNGNEYARFYVFAWVTYVIGGLLITLRNAGLLPINFITTHSAEIGSAVEVVLLSLALSDRYRVIKKERENLVLKNLEIQTKNNEELDEKVKVRTAALLEANEELKQVNEELSSTVEKVQQQHIEIAGQKRVVEEKSKDLELAYRSIQDSLTYAKRIQEAKLPKVDAIKDACADAFVLFRPREIVSGDFYWYAQVGSKKVVAAADCTGHGVPGAFMSMICSELLNEVVIERKELNPAAILRLLHDGVKNTLRQSETSNQDGMDLALLVLDQEHCTMTFAGAKNPLIYIQNGEMHRIRGDRMSVGGIKGRERKEFVEHCIPIESTTYVYMFSDGYQDQFGGPEGRKFMSASLRKFLWSNCQKEMMEQQVLLEQALDEWMNYPSMPAEKQLDDILIVGLKLCPNAPH